MKNSVHFETIFISVKPIIFKLQRTYYIKLWDKDDWLQEGRVILYHLLQDNPDLVNDQLTFYRYFKTKFSNHLKDVIRKQESQKRRFDKMVYEEVSEFGHAIKDRGLILDDYIAYKELLEKVEKSLSKEDKDKLSKVIAGQRFSGKAKFIRELRVNFKEFSQHILS
ncbi:sigma-70 family RNA polymerase sigma factor [Streptococcus sciuri]|uniref:Sigma-70 family RNA polymerase sigma factor n=1 Tax=Streptococcus sciuri TaxID=2973939 RepID=A0ABT2FAY1_9STRE|nr:sigma-70 family RNA polymerase sigma factor [Streptococcus sciuri]MCS4488955.1 sigma-70 family RNA polymerase sigma factor [Streptococcus sciuri]